MKITLRGKHMYLYKRVPRRYQSVRPRRFVWVSLHTDSQAQAASKATIAWELMVEGWEAKLAGDTSDAEARFQAARDLAAVRGFRYLNATAVAKLPRSALLERIEAVTVLSTGPDFREAGAFLGGAAEPEITISRAPDHYWTLAADRSFTRSKPRSGACHPKRASPSEKTSLRLRFAAFETWLTHRARVSTKSPLGEALKYRRGRHRPPSILR